MYRTGTIAILLTTLATVFLTVFIAVHSKDRTHSPKGKTPEKSISLPPGGVDLSYALAAPRFTLHEPVLLNFSVNNALAERIKLDLGPDRKGGFLFRVTKPDGSLLQLAPYLREGVGLRPEVSVEPGQAYTQRILLNELFQHTTPKLEFEPGKYEIEVRMAHPIQTPEGALITSDTGTRLSLEIGPRNPQRLQQVAEEFTRQALGGSRGQAAFEASFILSHIKDPVAVPYLAKLLASGGLGDLHAIEGLGRIGDESAVRVLISALGAEGDKAVMARGALSVIGATSPNPQLKGRIKEALASAPLK